MFQESLTMLSLVHFRCTKSWDILQGMQISIKRFRTLTKKLLELNFLIYDPDTFTYGITSYGENIIKSMHAQRAQNGARAVENPATLAHYYRGDWKPYRDELKK